MEKRVKRWLAILMSLVMVLSLLPAAAMPAIAAEIELGDGIVDDSVTPDETPVPDDSATPDETPVPDDGATPDETPAPDDGATPDETPVPDDGATPDETPVPDDSATPDETPAPDDGTTSDETPVPDDGATPDETPVPDDNATQGEEPAPDDVLQERAGTVLGDGITSDIWERDTQADTNANKTDISGSVCEKTARGVHLKSTAADGNGHGAVGSNSDWPGIFLNRTANEALAKETGDKFIEVTFERTAESNPRFGVILNYNSPTDGFFVGCNEDGGNWFLEGYKSDGSSNWQGLPSGGSPVAAGSTGTLRIEWNSTKLIRVVLDGQEIIGEYTFLNTYTGTGVGFRMNNYSDSYSEVYIKEMHYSGQQEITTNTVSGVVTDTNNSGIADATVTAAAGSSTYTTTTTAQGVYSLELPDGSYTLTVSKEGYTSSVATVEVNGSPVTSNVQLEISHTVQIPSDGVNDTWTQLEASKKGTPVDPVVVDGKLVLQATYDNVNNLNLDAPAVFTNAALDAALKQTTGEKFLSFTMVPENVNSGAGEDNWIGFGIALDYNGQVGGGANGYYIGYPSGQSTGWFVEYLGGNLSGANAYPGFTAPDVKLGEPLKVEIRWTDDQVTLKLNDVSYPLPNNGGHGGVPVTNNVGIKLGAKSISTDALQYKLATKLTLSDIHYSGQSTVTGHYVRGVVCDTSNRPLAGATVTASNGAAAVTDANGAYSMVLPEAVEKYTITASFDGYGDMTAEVEVNRNSSESVLENTNFTLPLLPVLTGKVTEQGNPAKAVNGAAVALYRTDAAESAEPFKSAVSGADGTYRIIGVPSGTYKLVVNCEGYETATVEAVTVVSQDVVQDVALPVFTAPTFTLSTSDMTVTVAQDFPRVVKYTMNGALAGAELWGQSAILDTIKINGTDVKPTVTGVKTNEQTAVYTMVIDSSNNNGTNVTATITAELRVGLNDLNNMNSAAAGRTLGFYITNVVYPNGDRLTNPVQTIEIPNHSLVSVRSTEPNAAVTGGKQAANTITSGDKSYPAAGNESSAQSGYQEDFFAAFVHNDRLSAGLSSNSAYAAQGTAGDQCYPVRVKFDAKDGGSTASIGLGSTLWYYDYDITNSEHGGDVKLSDTQLPREKRIIAPLDMPYAKVVITGDMNGNSKVDWQDAAIAYRETVMHIPAGGEGVANSVNLRISMNFGSMATNPFLIALDNVKRVAANTDGLGQFVLLKGYAGEGHDSNHPQYDNIGVRMGGSKDMLTLMREGGELGAIFGIHTNASEFYAEAIEEDNQVRRDSPGGNIHYGWNWLDQGIAINGVYDFASGLRASRWDRLFNIVKGYPFVVYVDVWGNNTSGTEDAFMTRALSNEIVGHENWRIAQEWAWANPYESTFQHWVTDYTYGDYGQKGKLNSNVLRFILNQYKDSFPPDFANYGGASNAPLLGGPAMQGFEGWQGDGEYNLSIYNTYNQMIYTKFLQHYPVVEWTNASNAVTIPYGVNHGGRGSTSDWTPEMQVRLSDGVDEIVVTRGLDTVLDTQASFSLDNEVEYRSRVVTLNGRIIVEGAPASAGEDNSFPANKATLRYLIPWYWNNAGGRVNPDDEKLYHWNAQGGQSEWALPRGWENLSTVVYYELSDQGRGPAKTLNVSGGRIVFPSGTKANTGYVVTKGAANAAAPQITYGTDLHLVDPSFNIDIAKGPWTVAGSGSAVRTTNSDGISVLKMIGGVSVSQKLNSLQPGQVYALYAAVDNRSNAKAVMTITDGDGNMVATNYTGRSIARNYISSYYLHNGHGMEAGTSFFQNMFLYFTPEAGKEYTLTLSREAGSGSVYFDDIRTVEYRGGMSPVVYDPVTGAATELHQDFENVPQGIWPFVVGPVEGIADNRTHLSELNGKFTQAGWDVKKMDDVIDGKWSVKSNGLHGRNNLVYQTIPQNFRFEPNKVYTVSFDYELGSAGSYVAVVGDGAYAGLGSLTVHNLEQTLSTKVPGNSGVDGNTTAKAKVGHIEFTVVGSESGQTWVGIYSKDNANSQGTSGSASAFGGYLDFVLDNLSIEAAAPEKNELALLLQEADPMVEEIYTETETGAWNAFVAARTNGHTVFDNEAATTAEVTDAVNALKTAMAKLTKASISISGTVTNANNAPVEGAVLTLENATYFPTGLTVTTGADGTFQFVSKSGVELLPGTYHIKAEATGYYVTTTGDIVVTKTDGAKTQDIQLEAEAPGAYVNDFNSGDISMMGHLDPPEGVDVDENIWPVMEWVEYNGSGALKVTFIGNGNSGGALDCRHISNVVDKTIAFANGTFSFDVTPLTAGERFGVTLRAGEKMNNRVCIGQQDSVGQWMGEFWKNSDNSSWTNVTNGKISVDRGATRNVRVVSQDSQFQVYIDGDKVYDVTMNDVQTTSGWAGINMRYHSGSEFILDNIRIIRADPADGVQNVTGTITARSGVAVSGAAVELYQGETRVAGTATNALGQYQVSRVAPGSYTLKVSAPFFTGQEKTVVVTLGSDLADQDFTLIPDISSLTTLIEQVKTLKEEAYTEETWAVLAEALAAAEEIDGNSSIAALNTAYRNLSNARDALVAKEADAVDYSALRDLYNQMAVVEDVGYTADGWDNFQAALDAALSVLSSEATQEQVDEAVTNLQSAFDALEMGNVGPNLAGLRAAYAAAADVVNSGYTAASWDAFEAARAAAKAILDVNGAGCTQSQVDDAALALTTAQNNLEMESVGVDLTALHGAYTAAENVTNDGYTAESWRAFEAARAAAKAILDVNGAGYTQSQVDDTVRALTIAQNNLTKGSGTDVDNGGDIWNDIDFFPATPPETPPVAPPVAPPSDGKTENPDGSTTTVVTDAETGAVTTSTEWPDGSKEVVEVRKDGTVAETKVDAEGGRAEKVTDPEKNVTVTVTDPTGETLVKAEIPAQIPTPAQKFEDVPDGHWADDAIHQMAGLGLVNGVGDNQFNYQGDIKRGDLTVILSRLSNGGTDYPLTFADVPADKYYAGSVAWAAKTGVVTGRSAELFKPEDTVTRAELAVMLYRYAKLVKLDTSMSGNELNAFVDGHSISDWAVEGMSWCVKSGILQGKNGGILDPGTNVTRAEVSVMLQRFINLMK